MSDEEIILADLKANDGHQSSWDWPADCRFAQKVGTETERDISARLLKSDTVLPAKIAIHQKYLSRVKIRRLRALRSLEKQGIVESVWMGTGIGGYTELGTRRIKTWSLV